MTAFATFANLCAAIGQRVIDRWEDLIAPYRATPDPDDQAPATFATWPCPDCGQDIPVTLHTQHIVIARPDTTDIHAHQLTHDREGA